MPGGSRSAVSPFFRTDCNPIVTRYLRRRFVLEGGVAIPRLDRVLLHLVDGQRTPVDPADVYFLEAVGSETLVRGRSRRRLEDVRPLGELMRLFKPHGFQRVHRNHAVNLRRILTIRRTGRDWELKLEPPVNRVLPIGRSRSYQTLVRIVRTGADEYHQKSLEAVRFVPLVGAEGWDSRECDAASGPSSSFGDTWSA